MQYRDIAVGMIEATYHDYKNEWIHSNEILEEQLDNFDIPVWNNMSIGTKQSAIEFVYKNRHSLELNSGVTQSWVQATAYFMIMNFAIVFAMDPQIDIFFDDIDFMMDEDVLNNSNVQEQMGIAEDFTEEF
jgi:hypothetical protein